LLSYVVLLLVRSFLASAAGSAKSMGAFVPQAVRACLLPSDRIALPRQANARAWLLPGRFASANQND
jgi:hypothetical protein